MSASTSHLIPGRSNRNQLNLQVGNPPHRSTSLAVPLGPPSHLGVPGRQRLALPAGYEACGHLVDFVVLLLRIQGAAEGSGGPAHSWEDWGRWRGVECSGGR